MSWRDNYREGSFRGVPFLTESHEFFSGRRKQDREFAKRDTGNSEDLGRKLRGFTLTLFVIGDDYFDQRDALIEAFEDEGAGELKHPYLGSKNVQPGEFTLSETVSEQRIARFTVRFSEAGEIKFPDTLEDDLNNTLNNANSLIDNSKSFFETTLDLLNTPSFVLDAASEIVTGTMTLIENSVKLVTEPVANLTFAIRNIKGDVRNLLSLPGELADRISGLFDTLLDEFGDDPETSSRILGNLRNISGSFDPVIGDTPSRNKQKINQDAIINLVTDIAVANRAKAAIDIDFPSVDNALLIRDQILNTLDQQLNVVNPVNGQPLISDEAFQFNKQLQTSLTRSIPRIGDTELINLKINKTLPVLVIAHDVFLDLDKESEIIDQNNIEHPGFILGGSTLQVSAN